ncbi:MAG: tetratricopeptide repeat protein [Deltaproteobacteria bacterium]|nr:MAG: tetratricopeptide repeat protein [Deltaproteobacteria bacterium]
MRAFGQIITIALLTAFVGGTIAEAASYRRNRRHKGFKARKKSYRIKKVEKRTKAQAATKKRRPMQLSVFERFAQERMQQKTAEQIQTLKQIIDSTPVPQRADLYFRLAEHYWENSKYYDFIGHKYDDYRGRPEWPEKARLQQQSFQTSKLYKKRAARQYFMIIKKYPDYRNLCQTYYFLGKNLFEMGQEKTALKVFKTMISRFAKEYPACPFIPNAYLAFGEHYFNNGAVRNALRSYQQVLHYRTSSIYGFALYKVAWCHYNLVNYPLSLRKFIEVVKHAKSQAARYSSQGRRIQLMREALRDLVLAYSQVGSAAEAKTRFFQIGGEGYYLKMLRNLGTLYRQQGKFPKVVTVYRDLMGITPKSPRVLYYQLYITQAVDRLKSKDETIRQTNKLVTMVKAFRKSGAGGKIQKEAEKEIRAQIKEFAQFRHYEGQKTRSGRYFQEAIAFYRAYLRAFGTRKESYEMHFWLGELLFKLRRYGEAAKEYIVALKLNPKGKYSLDAGYNTILAYHKLMKMRRMDVSDVRFRGRKGKNLQKRPLPKLAKEFLAAATLFLKYFPKGERAIDVAYKAAQTYYRYNHLKEALPRFNFLVQRHPKHEYAMYAAHYILDTYNIKEEWANLNKWSWKFYRMPELGNRKFKGEIRSIIIQSGIKICSKIEKEQKKPCDAAKCFSKFANEFPDNKRLAALALYNASINESKCKRPEQALAIRRKLIERYPRSRFVKRSVLEMADIYASRANFKQASRFYSMFAEKYPRDTKAINARVQSALFMEVLGENQKAIRLYRQLLGDRKFKRSQPKKFVALYFRLADMYKAQGQTRKYSRMMETFDRKRLGPYPQRLHARYEHAISLQRLGSRRKAMQILKRIPRAYDTLPSTQKKKYPKAGYAAAHVRFLDAEKLFADYTKIRPGKNMSQKRMTKLLAKKEKALVKAYKAYERVVAYRQGEWGVAALYRAGDLFLDYSKFFLNAPVPNLRPNVVKAVKRLLLSKGVPRRALYVFMRKPKIKALVDRQVERAKEAYKMKLQEAATPQEEKAAKFYKRCLNTGHQLRVYNRWTTAALNQLRKLKPYEYPRSMEIGWALRRALASSDFSFTKQTMGALPAPATPPPAPPANPATPAGKGNKSGNPPAGPLLGSR